MSKWIAAAGFVPVLSLLLVAVTYSTIANHNCGARHYETLIVLGCPPDPDGKPSSEERERVQEAVREFQAGRADHIIVTGGAAHSASAEAEIMAPLLILAGVPAKSVLVEPRALNTIDNIFYSYQIMQQRGWKSAEVISSPSHLARAALILEHYKICWRTQPARWPPEYSRLRVGKRYFHEALGTTVLRWFGFRPSAHLVSIRARGIERKSRPPGPQGIGLRT